jgi:Xaa-Pro aminopeptidase
MPVWTAHNPIRYALIFADGPAVMFEFKGCAHLCEGLPGIDEIRPSVAWIHLVAGDKSNRALDLWADEITELLRTHGGGNTRLVVDRLDPVAVAALATRRVAVLDGAPLIDHARSIKSADEIELMRWTIRVAEAGMARIHEHSLPGATEREL